VNVVTLRGTLKVEFTPLKLVPTKLAMLTVAMPMAAVVEVAVTVLPFMEPLADCSKVRPNESGMLTTVLMVPKVTARSVAGTAVPALTPKRPIVPA